MPPANVMDQVGSGVWGNDTDVGNKVVNGGEIGIGNARGMDNAAVLDKEREGSSVIKLLSAGGCMLKETDGGELDGANTC